MSSSKNADATPLISNSSCHTSGNTDVASRTELPLAQEVNVDKNTSPRPSSTNTEGNSSCVSVEHSNRSHEYSHVLGVVIPEGSQPGQLLFAQVPRHHPCVGQVISFRVPNGVLPGQRINLQVALPQSGPNAIAVPIAPNGTQWGYVNVLPEFGNVYQWHSGRVGREVYFGPLSAACCVFPGIMMPWLMWPLLCLCPLDVRDVVVTERDLLTVITPVTAHTIERT